MNFYPARVAPQDLFRKNSQLRGILDAPAELAALSLRKGALPLSLYEILSLLIAFATLVATILK